MADNYKTFRQQWNANQKELRNNLVKVDKFEQSIVLYLPHHAVLHSSAITEAAEWSYFDDILQGVTEEQMRRVPHNEDHSIAWMIWHMARIEDVAMNMLVTGTPQILHQDNWLDRMQMSYHHTGNETSNHDLAQLNATIDIEALLAYRLAVGRRSQEIVKNLQAADMSRKVDPERIKQVLADGAIMEAASGITDYWSKRNIAGILLMPATRHNMVHLNEIEKVKKKVS